MKPIKLQLQTKYLDGEIVEPPMWSRLLQKDKMTFYDESYRCFSNKSKRRSWQLVEKYSLPLQHAIFRFKTYC